MKFLLIISILLGTSISCNSNKTTIKSETSGASSSVSNDTIRIVNNDLEYEIIIFETGFQSWLATQPPMGYYGLQFLESKNKFFIIEYNNRVINDISRELYEQEINYDPTIRYGLEVNYLLYNYFIYFQEKYKQKL